MAEYMETSRQIIHSWTTKNAQQLISFARASQSGHDAIILSLNIGSRKEKQNKKERLKSKDEARDGYKNASEEIYPPAVERMDVDELNEAFKGSITNAARKVGMYKVPRNVGERDNIWYYKECWELKCRVRKLRRK